MSTMARLIEIIFLRKRFTPEDAQVEHQAGEQEIAQALEDRRIDGEFSLSRLLAMS